VVFENEFFCLIHTLNERRGTGLLGGVFGAVSSLVDTVTSATRPPKYLLLVKSAPQYKVISVSDLFPDIQERWKWLQSNITPKLSNSREDRDDMIQFIFLRINTLVDEANAKLQATEDQYTNTYFQRMFNLPNDELLSFYSCSLWKKFHRYGTMYLSKDHICFESKLLERKLVLPFAKITSIRKETSNISVLPSFLKIVTASEEVQIRRSATVVHIIARHLVLRSVSSCYDVIVTLHRIVTHTHHLILASNTCSRRSRRRMRYATVIVRLMSLFGL